MALTIRLLNRFFLKKTRFLLAVLGARGMSALYQSDDNNNANKGQPDAKAKLTQNPLILIVEILSHHLVSFIKRAGESILPIEGHILAMIAICLKKPCFSGRAKRLTIDGSIAVVLERKSASDMRFPNLSASLFS